MGIFKISTRNPSVGWCCGGLGFAHWSRNNLFPRKSLYDVQKQRERAARELCDLSSQSSSALQEKGGQLPDGAAPTFCSAITSTFCTLQLFHGILRLWHSWAELLEVCAHHMPRACLFRSLKRGGSVFYCSFLEILVLLLSPPLEGVDVCLWLCFLDTGNVSRSSMSSSFCTAAGPGVLARGGFIAKG